MVSNRERWDGDKAEQDKDNSNGNIDEGESKKGKERQDGVTDVGRRNCGGKREIKENIEGESTFLKHKR